MIEFYLDFLPPNSHLAATISTPSPGPPEPPAIVQVQDNHFTLPTVIKQVVY